MHAAALVVALLVLVLPGSARAQAPDPPPAPETPPPPIVTPPDAGEPLRTKAALSGGQYRRGDRNTFALESVIQPSGWDLGIATALRVSDGFEVPIAFDFGYELERVVEIDLGARLPMVRRGVVRPWVGAGAAVLYAEYTVGGFSSSGAPGAGKKQQGAEGFFVDAGIDFFVSERIVIGASLHHCSAVLIDDAPIELGGTALNASAGITF